MVISYGILTEAIVEEDDSVVDTYGNIYQVKGIDDPKGPSNTEFFIRCYQEREVSVNSVFLMLFKKDGIAVYLGKKPYDEIMKKFNEGCSSVFSGKTYGTTQGILDPELRIEDDFKIGTDERWLESLFGILFKNDETAVYLGKDQYEEIRKKIR